MIISKPLAADIRCAQATTTNASLLTVPAGRWYTAEVCISVSCGSSAITATPALTWTPADGTAAPSTTTILAQATAVSIASAPQQNAITTRVLVYGGGAGGTFSFATNSATAASVTMSGFLL